MTETTTTPAPDAGGPPANTGVDLGGAFRTFADGSELPVADVSAAETPAEEAPVFAREDLVTHDEAVGDADDADGEEDAALDEPTESAETTETDGVRTPSAKMRARPRIPRTSPSQRSMAKRASGMTAREPQHSHFSRTCSPRI
jgi:hypothetical protein